MKIDCIADTNFLIYLHEGHPVIEPFLTYNLGISFVTEVELLGFPGISSEDELLLSHLISDCFVLEWNLEIKQKTIDLRRKHIIKLPDAIIAATALVYDIPLVTADKAFAKLPELDLILIEVDR
jgi:predicted nucleic acid-binding protein